MYYDYYLIMIISFLITLGADLFVRFSYSKYKAMSIGKDITGFDVARRILDNNGLKSIYVTLVNGNLSDHYDPSKRVIKLSKEIYKGSSIASVAISAHEVGHALQDRDGYSFMNIRSKLVPFVNLCSKIGYIAVIIGLVFSLIDLAWIGLILLSMMLLFQLVTLPVEFNASKRAMEEIKKLGLLDDMDMEGAKSMLRAAAFTYVAGLVTTLLEMIRLFAVISGDRD